MGVPDTAVSGHRQEGHCSPVDNILAVKVVERHDDLRSKEERGWIVETVCCSEVCEEFTTWNVLQEHVEKPVVVIGPNPGWRGGGREEGGRGREEGKKREGEREEGERGREEGGGGEWKRDGKRGRRRRRGGGGE